MKMDYSKTKLSKNNLPKNIKRKRQDQKFIIFGKDRVTCQKISYTVSKFKMN